MQPELHNLQTWLQTQLFDRVPCKIAVIDRSYTIVENNWSFVEAFGEGRGKPCYQVFKRRQAPCGRCMAASTFEDGRVRVNEEEAVEKDGRRTDNVVHIAPIFDSGGRVSHVIEMSTDVTDVKQLQREYHTLFERVPCFLAVLNRDYRIVRANQHLRATFGEVTGKSCFEVLKRRKTRCEDCPAERTFADGGRHSSAHVGIDRKGVETHYVVNTSPLGRGEGDTPHYVLEMALDITETRRLQGELADANAFRENLVENAIDAVVALDNSDHVIIFNRAAEMLFGYPAETVLGRSPPPGMIPRRILQPATTKGPALVIPETTVKTSGDEAVPVRACGIVLERNDRSIGKAFFLQDLRKMKQLEREKIDAERLAAVGQTVAGLAHGIKNVLTGLEGGMYVVDGGLKRGDRERIDRGWDMLRRNIGRISTLVKNLLSFSKGRTPEVTMVSPGDLAHKVVDLYADRARQEGIALTREIEPDIPPAAMSAEDINICLENLLSNALDACKVTQRPDCAVTVRCREENGAVVFEVADEGCGMDYEVKRKAFTTFFSTKGAGGTGIGLLLTRKIVQEHGGKITVQSEPDEGSVFRLVFPRDRLPPLTSEGDDASEAPAMEPES